MATNVMIKEYPRNGSLNSGVIDSGQQRLMCVLLLDTSGSMEEGQLKEGISQFFRALREDPMQLPAWRSASSPLMMKPVSQCPARACRNCSCLTSTAAV